MAVGDETFEPKASQMVRVPSDDPHGNEALEDSLIMEIFRQFVRRQPDPCLSNMSDISDILGISNSIVGEYS
jgi:hypothetical protein